MADSDALRAKRSRYHRQGDHSLCLPGRCIDSPAPAGLVPIVGLAPPNKVAVRAVAAPKKATRRPENGSGQAKTGPEPVPDESKPLLAVDAPESASGKAPERVLGGIEAAVAAYVATLPYKGTDPRALLAQICVRLAQRVDETGAMPAAVRELRTMLLQLTEVPNQPAGPVDVARVRRAQRKLDVFLAGV